MGKLPFIAVLIGVLIGCGITIDFTKRFQQILEETGHCDTRGTLIPMTIGGVFLPIGMFWFGWTSSPYYLGFGGYLWGVFRGWSVIDFPADDFS